MSGCKSLEKLEVMHNKLTALSDGLIGCAKLKEVDASRNKLTSWPVLPPTPSLVKACVGGGGGIWLY